MGLKSAKLEMFAPLSVSPERLAQLVAFLKTLASTPPPGAGRAPLPRRSAPLTKLYATALSGNPSTMYRWSF